MVHGVRIEGTEVKEKCHDCFYIPVSHHWMSDLRKRENCINTAQRYHHYSQHSLLLFSLK